MDQLNAMKCVACRADSPRVTDAEIAEFKPQIPDWNMIEVDGIARLERTYKFKDFRQAMEFVNRVAEVAEEQGHHPDIYIYYNKVNLVLSTHKIGGLSYNDFIMAAKIDELAKMPAAV